MEEPTHRHRALLRARRQRPRRRRSAEQRDELATFQLIELHSVPCQQARAGLQDIEVARISQRVSRAFCNLLAVGEGGRCLKLRMLPPRLVANLYRRLSSWSKVSRTEWRQS